MTQTPATPTPSSTEMVAGLATQANRARRFLAIALLILSGLFCGVVGGVMLVEWSADRGGPGYPVSAAAKELRDMLQKNPTNEDLKTALRHEDARVRAAFDARRLRLQAGAWMLLVGLVVFVASGRWYLSMDRSLPKPRKAAEDLAEDAPRVSPRACSWMALTAIALALAAALVGAGLMVLPDHGGAKPETHYNDNWPAFRGADGSGTVAPGAYPAEWDGKTGANILWKTELPLAGKSSPVVWGGKVFVTAANAKEHLVICLDRETGRTLWQTAVQSAETAQRIVAGSPLEVFADTGYAASTPVTDGVRIYALFATGDVAAVDFFGTVVWARGFGVPQSQYSLCTSLAFAKDTLIFQFDQGADPDAKLSAIYGIDPASGNTLWKTERPVGPSWSSPIVAQTPKGPMIFTAGVPWVIAYNPATGAELWRATGLGGDLAPSPVYADGRVFVTGERAAAMAIPADGSGDVTDRILWKSEDGLSDASSPLADGKLFLQATSGGLVTCSSAADGKTLWDHTYPTAFWASPARVGENVYLCGEDGATRIFKLANTFEEVRVNPLGEDVYASPAFGDGRIFIRGAKHLFCVGSK